MIILQNNVTFPELVKRYRESVSESSQYDRDYYEICTLVAEIPDDGSDMHLHAVYRFAYAWMPTILKRWNDDRWGIGNIGQLFRIIRGVHGQNASLHFLAGMASDAPVNNSWVGTSKVLHFIQPNTFPIWDSRVAVVFGLGRVDQHNKRKRYKSYVEFVFEQVRQHGRSAMNVVNAPITSAGLPPVGVVRAIEKILFLEGLRLASAAGTVDEVGADLPVETIRDESTLSIE